MWSVNHLKSNWEATRTYKHPPPHLMKNPSEACKKGAWLNYIQRHAGELMSPEPWACLLSWRGLPDSEGPFIDWHLSFCLQVVLYVLLTCSPHNCPTGLWGEERTIKAGWIWKPPSSLRSWLTCRGPKSGLMNDYCVLFFFFLPPFPLCNR